MQGKSTEAEVYNPAFFESEKEASRIGAEVIVPLVMKLSTPTSVIDLGCGTGDWLAAFKDAGVQDIRGVDGDWVHRDQLAIAGHAFTVHDLTRAYLDDRRYDLAVSLEVAGGLPPQSGQWLVQSLTDLAPVVLFSSAIPHQDADTK
jgi:hypothetical protein